MFFLFTPTNSLFALGTGSRVVVRHPLHTCFKKNNDMFENGILLYILSCCSIAKPRMMTTVVQWTVEDVAAWLEQCLHLPYAEEFVQAGSSSWGQKFSYNFSLSRFCVQSTCLASCEAGIDGVQLVHLTNQGLLSLGVDTEEHVKCLLQPQTFRENSIYAFG